MRVKRMILAVAAGLAITVGAAVTPAKQADAQSTYHCYQSRHGGDCGCVTCAFNNCYCGAGSAPIGD